MSKDRPCLLPATYGELTQGTMFSCATAARYSGSSVFGLTITARCDVTQDKYRVLNYLPVVSLYDWLRKDGLDILVENEIADQEGKLRRKLKEKRLSTAIADYVDFRQIAETHFPINSVNNPKKSGAIDFHELVTEIEIFRKIRSTDNFDYIFSWFNDNRQPKVIDLIHRLSRHNVLGYYFLERIDLSTKDPSPHVCLLREISTLPKAIAQCIGTGLSKEDYDQMTLDDTPHIGLCIPFGDLAMPVSQIESPTIEHILQTFSYLFSRIGIADPDKLVLDEIVSSSVA